MQTLQNFPKHFFEAINAMTRHRKAITFTLDTLVIDAIQKVAESHGDSTSRHIEKVLFDYCKSQKAIEPSESRLGENRGGDRRKKPKDSTTKSDA
ncbi:hypothetical protein [Leptolyngbya sp. FACHB-1624]|uniref:hypothetical protein n=1 Tax=Leptolyngbya sp. FACHB-1624 TaxID=2692802 RepID=UPI0039EA5DB8